MHGDQNTLRGQGLAVLGVSTHELMRQSAGKLTAKAVHSKCLATPSRKDGGFVKVRRPLNGKEPNVLWKVTALDIVGHGLRAPMEA